MAANFPDSSRPKSGEQGNSSRSVRGYPEIPEWFIRSNIFQVIQWYLKGQGSVAIDQKKIECYLLYFYNVYTEYPVSRRSPILKLDQLVFEPPLGTLMDQQICARNNIKVCYVSMHKNNLIFECEQLLYNMLIEKENGIRRGVDFPSYDSFIEKVLYMSRREIPRFMELLEKQDKERADRAMERSKEDKEDEEIMEELGDSLIAHRSSPASQSWSDSIESGPPARLRDRSSESDFSSQERAEQAGNSSSSLEQEAFHLEVGASATDASSSMGINNGTRPMTEVIEIDSETSEDGNLINIS
ncbi:uncharacterized protein LOC129786775 [Lutzomyia longipalpis]|uniref:Uncharacterized protein n=1 Tax=Lutzomyia longipalpis TaxID=7200 RepID=A0A1B0CGY3_LUTLO|nr:uncharacterized protein LOC129786775 [Lutzomyia longipalpis]